MESVLRYPRYLGLPALLGVAMWLQFRSVLHHDPAWLIHGTEVMLHGGRLYRDVFEVNPPLIFYLTTPPVWFAHLIGLFDINVFIAYVFILAAICLLIVWMLLRRDLMLAPRVRNAMLLAVTLVLTISPVERFGQREHLMFILVLPYLFLAGNRSRDINCGRTLAVTIGVFAALGFCLKPYFLIIPAILEFYLVVRRGGFKRSVRPETWALACTGLLYFLGILIFTPDYLTVIIPIVRVVYDLGYGSDLSVVLARPELIFLPIILTLHVITRRRQGVPEIGDILSLACSGFLVIYVMQMKGWRYHIYPLDAALLVLMSHIFLQGLAPAAGYAPMRALNAAFGVVLGLLFAADGAQRYQYSFRPTRSFMTDMAPLVRTLPPGAPIYVFTAGYFNGFPLVNYYHLGWPSRFGAFLPLPGLIAQATPDPEITQFLRDAVVADLLRQPPTLIFVDVAQPRYRFDGRDFDYITYFSADPRFAAIWAGYTDEGVVDTFRVFRRTVPLGGV